MHFEAFCLLNIIWCEMMSGWKVIVVIDFAKDYWIHLNHLNSVLFSGCDSFESCLSGILTLGMPTVAALNGHITAGGAMLGLSFDKRLMVADSKRHSASVGFGGFRRWQDARWWLLRMYQYQVMNHWICEVCNVEILFARVPSFHNYDMGELMRATIGENLWNL